MKLLGFLNLAAMGYMAVLINRIQSEEIDMTDRSVMGATACCLALDVLLTIYAIIL